MAGPWDVIDEQPIAATAPGGGWDVVEELPLGQAAAPRDVPLGESFRRIATETFRTGAQRAALALTGPAVIAEKGINLFRDEPTTAASDWMFQTFVDPNTAAINEARMKPGERPSIVGATVGALAGLTPELLQGGMLGRGERMVRSGVEAVRPLAERVATELYRGLVASQPVAQTQALQRVNELEAQGTPSDIANSAALREYAINTPTMALPAAAPGRVLTRAATGAATNVAGNTLAINEMNRLLQDAGQGDKAVDPLALEVATPAAALGAVMGMLFGPRAGRAVRRPADGGGAEPPAPAITPELRADFDRWQDVLAANGIASIDDPRAATAVQWLNTREAKLAERRPGFGTEGTTGADQARVLDEIQAGERNPSQVPYRGRQAPETGTILAGPEPGQAYRDTPENAAGRARAEDLQAEARTDLERTFDVAGRQRARKEAGVEEGMNVTDVRAGGTASPEGTAALQPEQFVYYGAKVTDGQMVAGERVEVVGEGPAIMVDGKPVQTTVVRFPDREGAPEMPVPSKDLKAFQRPANPRFAQDVRASSYAPPRGVGLGEQQPRPRRAAQRIKVEGDEAIEGEVTGRTYEPVPRELGGPETARQAEQPQQPVAALEAPRPALEAPKAEPAADAAPQAAEPAPGPAPRQPKGIRPLSASTLIRELNRSGGIDATEQADITGESKGRRGDVPGLFRKGGRTIDDIATFLYERGYISEAEYADVDGGSQRARDILREALDGNEIRSVAELEAEGARLAAEDARRAEQEARADQRTADDEAAAEAAGRALDLPFREFVPDVQARHPRVMFEAQQHPNGNIDVALIEVKNAADLGQGHARRVMEDVVGWADANGREVWLDAVPLLKKMPDGETRQVMTLEELVRWYERFGFEALPDGRQQHSNARTMVRYPRLDFTDDWGFDFPLKGVDDEKAAGPRQPAGPEGTAEAPVRPGEDDARAAPEEPPAPGGRRDDAGPDSRAAEAGAGAEREAPAGQRPAGEPERGGRDDFDLEGYDRDGLEGRERARVEADEAQARAAADAERKAAADRQRDAFELTGSDRAADANPRQKDILDELRQGEALREGMEGRGDAGTLFANPLEPMWDFLGKVLALDKRGWDKLKRDWQQQVKLLKLSYGRPKPKGWRRSWVAIPQAIVFSVDGQMRSLASRFDKSPTINKIADMFNARPGEGASVGETYGQAIDSRSKQFENSLFRALGEAFSEISDRGQAAREQITRLVQNRQNIKPGAPLHDAARAIADLMDEIFDYAEKSGMKIGKRENYFPRVYSVDKITADQPGFVAAATKAYRLMDPNLSVAEAKQLAENWLRAETLAGLGVTEHPFVDMGNAIPHGDFRKSRVLPKQIDDIMRPYLVQDPMEVMLSYVRKVARRAEWERRFGGTERKSDGTVTSTAKFDAMVKDLEAEGNIAALPELVSLIKAASGELPSDVGIYARKAVSWVRALTIIHYLTHATVSSFSEPIVAVARTGRLSTVPRLYYDSIKAIAKTGDMVQMRQMAELLGVVVDHLSTDTVAAHRFNVDSGQIGSEWANRLANRSMVLTGLHHWTEANRTAMVKIAQEFVHHMAAEVQTNPKSKVARFQLRDMGIPEADVDAFAKWLNKAGKLTADQLHAEMKAGSRMADLYRSAMTRMVNEVIMNPSHADRPKFAAHPVAGVAYSLMSYLYGFQKNVNQRLYNLVKQSAGKDLTWAERGHFLVPLIAAPLIVAMQGALMGVRDLWSDPERVAKRTPEEAALRAVSYSGFLGPVDPVMNLLTGVRYERDLANAIVGPFTGDVLKLMQNIAKAPTDRNSDNTNTHERQIAKDAYNVLVDPALKAGLAALPLSLPTAAAVQAVGTHQTREKFMTLMAGEKQGRGGRGEDRAGGRADDRSGGR